jgi:hypothetical protein
MNSELKNLVGIPMYESWIEMLKTLGPNGRTHKISLLVASMLRFAHEASIKKHLTITESYSSIYESADQAKIETELYPIVCALLTDAGLQWERHGKNGRHYDLAKESIVNFCRWSEMPWE